MQRLTKFYTKSLFVQNRRIIVNFHEERFLLRLYFCRATKRIYDFFLIFDRYLIIQIINGQKDLLTRLFELE